MKVITIKQPWATLIAKGYKEYEFRTWNTKYRGQLLIHAGNNIDAEAMKRFEYLKLDYPRGQIIAKVNLVDCITLTDEFGQYLYKKNPNVYKWTITKNDWEGYAFKLEDVKEIERINIKGNLGLWDYKGEIYERNN